MNRLLVIASVQGIVGRMSRMLSVEGYELVRCRGPRALERLGNDHYAAVVLDWDLKPAPSREIVAAAKSRSIPINVASLAPAARRYAQYGRWISPDPAGLAAARISNPQSLNRYAYVLNSPLMMSDPTGLLGCFRYLPDGVCGPNNNGGEGYDGGGQATCLVDGGVGDCGQFSHLNEFDIYGLQVAQQAAAAQAAAQLAPPASTTTTIVDPETGETISTNTVLYPPIYDSNNVAGNSGIGWTWWGTFAGSLSGGFSLASAANNGSADPTLDDRANALAQAINKTGVQSLQNPCTVVGFYAASAAAATGTALYQIGSASAAFPAFSEGLASLGTTVATATGWLARTRQLGQKAVAFVVSTTAKGLNAVCQSF